MVNCSLLLLVLFLLGCWLLFWCGVGCSVAVLHRCSSSQLLAAVHLRWLPGRNLAVALLCLCSAGCCSASAGFSCSSSLFFPISILQLLGATEICWFGFTVPPSLTAAICFSISWLLCAPLASAAPFLLTWLPFFSLLAALLVAAPHFSCSLFTTAPPSLVAAAVFPCAPPLLSQLAALGAAYFFSHSLAAVHLCFSSLLFFFP